MKLNKFDEWVLNNPVKFYGFQIVYIALCWIGYYGL